MTFDENEKLTLFLIWCIGERGLSIDFHDGFGDKEINLWVTSHGAFLEFLSEAYEIKESFEFYICQEALYLISNDKQFRGVGLNKEKTDFFENKITITVG